MSSENKVMCSKAGVCGKNDGCPHNKPHIHDRHCNSRCTIMGDTRCAKEFVDKNHLKGKMSNIWEN